jgi:TfoX/Sxy family transcriptional regulator of competence genes
MESEISSVLEGFTQRFHCKKKPMFGCPVYFVNDNMFTGVKSEKVFLRLSQEDRSAIQAACDEVVPFEPRENFFMKEYVEIPESKLEDKEFMTFWIERSYLFTASLLPKEKVKKNKK